MAVKGVLRVLSLVLLLTGARNGFAQNFTNLDFEDATIVREGVAGLPPPVGNDIVASNAIPGWTAYVNGNPRGFIVFDSTTGGGIELVGTNNYMVSPTPVPGGVDPVQGDYSIVLRSGGIARGDLLTASIGQTGTIPVIAQAMTFEGNFDGKISFAGHDLDYSVTGKVGTYNIYTADIVSFSGQTGQLLFSTLPSINGLTELGGIIDNIQFIAVPVPEPGTMALFAAGILFLRRLRKSSH